MEDDPIVSIKKGLHEKIKKKKKKKGLHERVVIVPRTTSIEISILGTS